MKTPTSHYDFPSTPARDLTSHDPPLLPRPLLSVPPTGSLSIKPIHLAHVALRPFQFPSVSHFVDDAVAAITRDAAARGLSDRTVAWWRASLAVFARFLREQKADRAFLSGDLQRQILVLEEWVCWLRAERKVSHTTVRTYWSALMAIGQRLERAHGLVNPFGILEAPKAGRAQPRVLTKGDSERLVTVVANVQWRSPFLRARNLAIVGCMLLAGLRRGEVLRLKISDVHLEDGSFSIRQGKGQYGGKHRTAYMAPQLRIILVEYLERRQRAGKCVPELITLEQKDAPASVTTIKRLFERLTLLAGFWVSPHMLRHTYATLLRKADVPDRIAMELMGHSSLAMLKRYSHVFDGEVEAEARKLQLDVEI